MVADRDHHGGSLPDLAGFATDVGPNGMDGATVSLPASRRTLYVRAPGARVQAARERYEGYALPRETERGLADADDYAHVLTLSWELAEGRDGGAVLTLDPAVPPRAEDVVAERRAANRARAAAQPTPLLGALALAGGRVRRRARRRAARGHDGDRRLPLVHRLGPRHDDRAARPAARDRPRARRRRGAAHVRGRARRRPVPNRFPDAGGPAEYNTIDASLWFVEAVRAYVARTGDLAFLRDVFPALEAVIAAYRAGTRYGIGVDADGLVRGGAAGVQLTWMDAKVGDRVITPRHGKPVEISALWYNALRACETFAQQLGRPADAYRARRSAPRRGCSGSGTPSAAGATTCSTARTATTPRCARTSSSPSRSRRARSTTRERARSSTSARRSSGRRSACARSRRAIRRTSARTPARKRSATPRTTRARSGRGCSARSPAPTCARTAIPNAPARYVAPLLDALDADALGTLCEIADGDPPHAPRGCPAQAWSIGELIAVLTLLGERHAGSRSRSAMLSTLQS